MTQISNVQPNHNPISYGKPKVTVISIELAEVVLTEDDLVLFGRQFSDDYIKWITAWVDTHAAGSSVTINGSIWAKESFSISIKANSIKDLTKISMFIGYAFGQQDNGR